MDDVNTLHKELYDEYSVTVRGIANSRLINKALVETVVESTFAEALLRADELETHPSHCQWVTNKALEVIEILNNSQNQGGVAGA